MLLGKRGAAWTPGARSGRRPLVTFFSNDICPLSPWMFVSPCRRGWVSRSLVGSEAFLRKVVLLEDAEVCTGRWRCPQLFWKVRTMKMQALAHMPSQLLWALGSLLCLDDWVLRVEMGQAGLCTERCRACQQKFHADASGAVTDGNYWREHTRCLLSSQSQVCTTSISENAEKWLYSRMETEVSESQRLGFKSQLCCFSRKTVSNLHSSPSCKMWIQYPPPSY